MRAFALFSIFWIVLLTSTVSLGASDAELVEYISRCTLKKGKLTYDIKVAIQINTREGEDYTLVSIPFSKGNAITNLDAWISDEQLNIIRTLKKSEIRTVSAVSDMALYEDEFVKTFQLKHPTYPYQVHYSFSLTYTNFIGIADWHPTIGRLPCKRAELIFEVENDFKFSTYQRGVEKPQVKVLDESTVYTWEALNTQVNKAELYGPSYLESLPTVKINPSTFKYGLEGKLHSWKDFGNWQYNTNKGLRDLPDSEKRSIDLLLKGVTDEKEKIRKLYHYLQDHTRYILVVEGIGGLKPYPASYVASNKYGDCKALTNYMMAMLEYIGIPSFYTKVRAGDEIVPLIHELPGQQFNHVLVTVPLKADTLWLECTSKYDPFNYVGTFTQNREALLVTEHSSRVIRTPALQPEQVRELRKIEALVMEDGLSSLQLEFELKGYNFELFNQLLHNYTKSEQEAYIRKILPYADFEIQNWDIEQNNRDNDFIRLSISLTTRSFAKKYGDQLIIRAMPFDVPVLKETNEREQPLALPYPISQADSVIIKLADNLEIVELPKAAHLEEGGSFFESEIAKIGDHSVSLSRAWTLEARHYSGEGYTSIHNFLKGIKTYENSSAIVVKRK